MRAGALAGVIALLFALVQPVGADDAFSRGFDAGTVKSLKRVRPNDGLFAESGATERVGLLIAAAAAIRIKGSVAANRPADTMTAAESAVFRRLLKGRTAGEQVYWTYFFQGTLIDIGRAEGDRPVVGFYHPLTDVWLLTLWQYRDGTPRLVDLAAVTGETLRNDKKVYVIPGYLLVSGRPIVAGLIANHRDNFARFRQLHPVQAKGAPGPLPASEWELILARFELFGSTILSLRSDRPYWQRLAQFRTAIREQRPGKIAALLGGQSIQPAQRLTELPAAVRETLRPVGHLAHASGSTVVFGTPLDGGLLVFADFALRPSEDQPPDLTGFLTVNVRTIE